MKMRFVVRSVQQQWKPPFGKKIEENEYEVKEGQSFERIRGNGNDESVFKAIRLTGGAAKVEYSKLFTLKEGNPGNYTLELKKDDPVSMTYLWGEDGVTKTITYKGIVAEEGF